MITKHPPESVQRPPLARIPRPGSTRKAVGFIVGLVLLMIGGGILAGVLMRSGTVATVPAQDPGAGARPPSAALARPLPASDAALMGLQTLSPARAAGFVLTDQHGQRISLAQLDRHHAVVLMFMDDRCTDVCPLVAQEVADAYHRLGQQAAAVEFIAVNVNAAHSDTHWLRSFLARTSPELVSVPTFHYVTGSPAALQRVWAAYHITVKVDPTTGAVYHSEGMYFIAPGGTERYEATPFANMRSNGTGWLPPGTIVQWGVGIARYARAVSAASGAGN